MVARILGLAGLASLSAVYAVPALQGRQSITTLSTSQVAAFRPYTRYASTAACEPSQTLTWTCGVNCLANPTFEPVASGGDGDVVQFWYVGFDPTLETVIVAHQGTDVTKLLPVLTDLDIIMAPLDPILFPGISPLVQVHSGFAHAQSLAAADVLSAVNTTITRFGAKEVTLVGHSLGAAIALLDSVYLPLHLPGITFQTRCYGLPRVGNQAFADYVDAHVTSLNHVNNREDPVPTLPGRFLGFHHPSGEIHIQDSEAWDACPGQDNPSVLCSVGDVPNIFESNSTDHGGPYDGIEMGC